MLTGRNEEFGSLKKKDINGFSRRGIPFVQGGIILCKRDANRHVADSEKVTIAGLTSRKQNERGGIKRNDNNRRKLEILSVVILRRGNRSHNGAGSGYNFSLVRDL